MAQSKTFKYPCPKCNDIQEYDISQDYHFVKCEKCGRLFTPDKNELSSKEIKLLDDIIKKSELLGEWNNYLKHINWDNPKIPYWQSTVRQIAGERDELYKSLTELILAKHHDF